MADDPNTEEVAEETSSRSPLFTIAIVAAIIIVPTVLALITLRVATQGLIEPGEAAEQTTNDLIPDSIQTVQFDQQYTAVLRDSEDFPASTFAFKVALDVTTPQTAALIDRHRPRFNDMIISVHSFRTRNELDDPLVKQSIQRSVRDNANDILRRLGASENDRVVDVFHEQYVVQD